MPFYSRVFKKGSPNGKITVYLGRRDFVDHISHVDPIGIADLPAYTDTVFRDRLDTTTLQAGPNLEKSHMKWLLTSENLRTVTLCLVPRLSIRGQFELMSLVADNSWNSEPFFWTKHHTSLGSCSMHYFQFCSNLFWSRHQKSGT